MKSSAVYRSYRAVYFEYVPGIEKFRFYERDTTHSKECINELIVLRRLHKCSCVDIRVCAGNSLICKELIGRVPGTSRTWSWLWCGSWSHRLVSFFAVAVFVFLAAGGCVNCVSADSTISYVGCSTMARPVIDCVNLPRESVLGSIIVIPRYTSALPCMGLHLGLLSAVIPLSG